MDLDAREGAPVVENRPRDAGELAITGAYGTA
jgi:hypothetical protein